MDEGANTGKADYGRAVCRG